MNSFLQKSRQLFCAKYAALFLGSLSISANAAVITFGDSFAIAPYSEAGFVVTASNNGNGVFGPNSVWSSYYLAIGGASTIVTVSSADNGPFNLTSLDIGSFTGDDASVTIDALVIGGRSLNSTYNSVSAPQNVVLNWSNITSFTVSGNSDVGIDNIVVTPSAVPEPGAAATALVLASGMIGLVTRRRR